MKNKKLIIFGVLLITITFLGIIFTLNFKNKEQEYIFYEDKEFKLSTKLDINSTKQNKNAFKKCKKEKYCQVPIYVNDIEVLSENIILEKSKTPLIVENFLVFETTSNGERNLNIVNKYNQIKTLYSISDYEYENDVLNVKYVNSETEKSDMGPFEKITIKYNLKNGKVTIKEANIDEKASYKDVFENLEYYKLNNPIDEYHYEKTQDILFKDSFKINNKKIYVNSAGYLSFSDDLDIPNEDPFEGKYNVSVKAVNNSYISKSIDSKGTKIQIYDKYMNILKTIYAINEDNYIGLNLIKDYYFVYAVENNGYIDIYRYDTLKNTFTKETSINEEAIIRNLRDLTNKATIYTEGDSLLYSKKTSGAFSDSLVHNGKTIYFNTKGEFSFNKVEEFKEKVLLPFENYISVIHFINDLYIHIYVDFDNSVLTQIKIYDKNLNQIKTGFSTSTMNPRIKDDDLYYTVNNCEGTKNDGTKGFITEIYKYNTKTKSKIHVFNIEHSENLDCKK